MNMSVNIKIKSKQVTKKEEYDNTMKEEIRGKVRAKRRSKTRAAFKQRRSS